MPLQLQSGILSAFQVLEGIPGLGNILRPDTLNVQQRWKNKPWICLKFNLTCQLISTFKNYKCMHNFILNVVYKVENS